MRPERPPHRRPAVSANLLAVRAAAIDRDVADPSGLCSGRRSSTDKQEPPAESTGGSATLEYGYYLLVTMSSATARLQPQAARSCGRSEPNQLGPPARSQ
jgi:hypothetical protein